MLNSGQPGFVNAPVTKFVLFIVVTTTLFGPILSSQRRLVLSADEVFTRGQVWRLVTHNFVFSTPGELLFGVILLYYFRQFERQLGSSRYAARAVVTGILHTAALCAAQALVPDARLASGPYALIFANLAHFFFETPPVYVFELFGAIALSDKFFPYLTALQLAVSAPGRSSFPVLSAIAAGLAIRAPAVADLVVCPKPVVDLASSTVLPLLGTAPTPRAYPRRRSARPENGQNASAAAGEEAPPPNALGDGVSREHVATLQAMGFSREHAVAALQRCGDDVQLATERLLSEAS